MRPVSNICSNISGFFYLAENLLAIHIETNILAGSHRNENIGVQTSLAFIDSIIMLIPQQTRGQDPPWTGCQTITEDRLVIPASKASIRNPLSAALQLFKRNHREPFMCK